MSLCLQPAVSGLSFSHAMNPKNQFKAEKLHNVALRGFGQKLMYKIKHQFPEARVGDSMGQTVHREDPVINTLCI